MDLDGFRAFVLDSGIDVWTWIDMAISVATADHEDEMKERRDGIIQKLYASRCQNCEGTERREQKQELGKNLDGIGEEVGVDDDEQRKILEIKMLLDDQSQSEGNLIDLLQMLADMDTSFKALKETDIGRHVTSLRKHPSGEVRRLVKFLVRKWKDTVDEWVRLNTPPEESTEDDKRSPIGEAHQEEGNQNGVVRAEVIHQPNAHNKFSAPSKGKVRQNQTEPDKQKHLHDQNCQESLHAAKKQRTSQITDFHSMATSTGGTVPVKYW